MISSHEFKISEAILEIMDDRKFNQFAGKVLDIGVCMAVEAWNLSTNAIINRYNLAVILFYNRL